MANRKHSKVAKKTEIRKIVDNLLLDGVTIEKIVSHLKGLAGQGVIKEEDVPSKSSVGRYSKGFLAKLERMDIAREQSKVIVERAKGDGLVVEEAAVALVLNEMMKILMPEDDEKGITPQQVASIAVALSKLQSSSSTRERAKIEVRKEMDRLSKLAAREVGKLAKKGGLSKEAVEEIKNKILGITA